MDSRDSKSILARQPGVLCFLFALLSLVAAAWLFAEGDFPGIPVGGHTYLEFGGVSINGHVLPDRAFYFVPGGLCVVSVCLLCAGWRMVRAKHEGL
jgi:hypothetical protein